METFQAAIMSGDCPREGACVTTGRGRAKDPALPSGPESACHYEEVRLLLPSCTHGVLLTAGELKAKTEGREQRRKRPCP